MLKLSPYALDGIRLLSLAYRASKQEAGQTWVRHFNTQELGGTWELLYGDAGKGVQYLVGLPAHKDFLMLALPGTNEPRDWGTNLAFPTRKIRDVPGAFRSGYLHAAYSLEVDFPRRLIQQWGVRLGDYPLVIVAHSLGGPVGGCLAAISAASRTWPLDWIVGLVTFASPRFCTPEAADWLTATYPPPVGQRISVGVDIVPHAVARFYRKHALDPVHIGHDLVLRPRGNVRDEIRAALRKPGFQPLGDHGVDETIRPAIEAISARDKLQNVDTEPPEW